MTQQPDPFSELRGLMAEALACLPSNESDDELCTEHFFIKRASAHFQTLLDERDRLIGENERLRLIATDAALLGQVVASSYTPDHKPHTLKNPKTGDVVTGPIADAVIELVKIIIEQGNTARQALSQEIG